MALFFLFVQIESLKIEEGGISPEMPDICIAYKLHLECGRLINLYDWLQASCSHLLFSITVLFQSFLLKHDVFLMSI